jgi:RNA polymerase sigma-70 factor (ECF subfamily)
MTPNTPERCIESNWSIVELKQERHLILAAQRGDEQALGRLYDAYVDRIYRYILYRVNDSETAEDLTSDVFLRVVEGLPTYQDRDVPFLAWLYRIAHARLIDHYRQTTRRGPHQDIESVNVHLDDDLDGVLMTTYHQDKVREAMRSLTAEQQQVIVLRFMEGNNLQETADALGKTVGAVKVMQHRALESLSRALIKQGVEYEQE